MNSNHERWMIRLMIVFLIVMTGTLNTTHLVFADDSAQVIGIWKLVSFETEWQATGTRASEMGKNPTGYLILTPEGRMMAILTSEGRKSPKTDQDRMDLFKSIIAYTGMRRLDGDKWITKVDVSWIPAWIGTEQVRSFRVDGDRLQVISMWVKDFVKLERGMARGILTFERVK
jgi:Lipocalin-like domain